MSVLFQDIVEAKIYKNNKGRWRVISKNKKTVEVEDCNTEQRSILSVKEWNDKELICEFAIKYDNENEASTDLSKLTKTELTHLVSLILNDMGLTPEILDFINEIKSHRLEILQNQEDVKKNTEKGEFYNHQEFLPNRDFSQKEIDLILSHLDPNVFRGPRGPKGPKGDKGESCNIPLWIEISCLITIALTIYIIINIFM